MKNRPRRIEFKRPIVGNSIPESAIKNITVSELFVCIWPQRISLPRADIVICYCYNKDLKKHFAEMLKIPFKTSLSSASKKILIIDKKSDFLDQEEHYFLRNLRKGNFLQLVVTTAENSYCCQGNFEDELKFKEMLSLLKSSDGEEELFSDYMYNNFNVINKQSFSFAVYLKTKFSKRESCYFFSREGLLENLPVYGIFAMGKINSKKGKKVHSAEDIGKMWQEIVDYVEQTSREDKKLGKQIKQKLIDELLKLEE